MNQIPMHVHATLYLSVHQLMDIWGISNCWLFELCFCEYSCTGLCVDMCQVQSEEPDGEVPPAGAEPLTQGGKQRAA